MTGPADDEVTAAIFLVSRVGDQEAGLVKKLLEATGHPVTRLDAEFAPSGGLVVDLDRRAILVDGRWIRPTVTWLRHFTDRAMPAQHRALRRAFSADSWPALADQIQVVSMAAVAHRDPGLLVQLAAASTCGVPIPRTLVTTEPGEAAKRLASPRVIVKALHRHFIEASPGLLTGVFPEVVAGGALHRIPAGPPVVVQEYMDHDTEIRLYYARGQPPVAFAIAKPGPGSEWLDPAAVSAEWIEPPEPVASAAAALAESLSIDYGAFDFLISDGKPVFLEVNLAGDWRWLENKIGAAPVTTAVVRMLRSMHRRSVANDRRLSGGSASGVSPVLFLSSGVSRASVDKNEQAL